MDRHTDREGDVELRERLAAMVRRWPLVAAAVLAGLLLAAGVAILTPATYEARTRLFVAAGVDVPGPDGRPVLGRDLAATRLGSYTALASSPDVLGSAARRLGLADSPDELAGRVRATVPPGTQLIDVRAADRTAAGAATLANVVGDRLGRAIEALEALATGRPGPVRVQTVASAIPPSTPAWPSRSVLLTTGAVAGLLAGGSGVLLSERRRANRPPGPARDVPP